MKWFSKDDLKFYTSAIVIAFTLIYAINVTTASPRWLVDDAYIILRYAENLAHHGALTWNVGEAPIEGYTGVAFPVLIAAAVKLGISPALAAHALGVAFYFLGGLFIFLILGGFNFGSVVALMLYFTAPFMFTHEWSGLETTTFASAMLLAIYAFVSRRRKLFLFAALFLSFTRPEGVLLSVLLLILYRPFSFMSLLVYLVPLAAYFLWRWVYYGGLLPNTYYAKAGDSPVSILDYAAWCIRRWTLYGRVLPDSGSAYRTGTIAMTRNAADLFAFLRGFLLRPALAALVVIAWGSVRKRALLAAVTAAYCVFVVIGYLTFNLQMNFSHRFFVPFYPLAVLALGGLMKESRLSLRLVLAVVFLIAPQMRINLDQIARRDERSYTSTHKQMLEDEHVAVGKYLRETIPPDEWLIVYADAGAIPYYSKLKTVDFGGLNDTYLAREKPGVDEAADYFFSRNAAAVVLTETEQSIDFDAARLKRIFEDPRFERYTLVRRYGSAARTGYFQVLYIRNDLVPPR